MRLENKDLEILRNLFSDEIVLVRYKSSMLSFNLYE